MSGRPSRFDLALDLLVFAGFGITAVVAPSPRQEPASLAALALAGFVFARRGKGSRVLAILCFLLAWFVAPLVGWVVLALLWTARAALSRRSPTRDAAETASHASDVPTASVGHTPGPSTTAGASPPVEPPPPPEPARPSADDVERALREAHGELWFAVATAHDDAEVRQRAIRALIDRASEADPALLAEAAVAESTAELQLDAVATLAQLRTKAAIEALVSILTRGREGHVWWPVLEAAVRALARSGDPSVVPHLVEAFDAQEDLLPRELGEALAGFGAEAAAALLDALLQPDRREKARAAKNRARIVEKRVRLVAALARLGHEPAGPALVELLASQEPRLRAAAARALGLLRHAPARAELTRSLSDSDAFVRAAAARALGDVGAPETVDHLLRLGEDPADDVLQAVAEALGKLSDPRAVDLLSRLLGRSALRAAAAESLVAIGGAGAAEALRSHLDDRDVPLRVAVLDLLRVLHARNFAREIRALLARADTDLRAAAAAALVELGDPAAERDLERRLTDVDGGVRSFALRALARLGSPVARALEAARDPDPRVREAAWDVGGAPALTPPREALATALRDPSAPVRAAATRAARARPDARDLLAEALDRLPEETREATFRSLAEDARGVQALVAALPRLDWDGRRCAVEALVALGTAGVPTLAAELEQAPPLARYWRVEALRRIASRDAEAALAEAAGRETDARVRRRAGLSA